MEKTIELKTSTIYIGEDNIIHHNYKLTRRIDLNDAKEISERINEIAKETPDGKKLLLSSMSNLLNMSSEVRSYLANYPSKYTWKIALTYDNSIAHIFTSLVLALVSPRFESKSFSNSSFISTFFLL